jgi:hypothetical protein
MPVVSWMKEYHLGPWMKREPARFIRSRDQMPPDHPFKVRNILAE